LPCESRELPSFYLKNPISMRLGFFLPGGK